MPFAPATRVNYFDRQFIRLAELRDEQAYHLQLRRRHNLSHHSWGIVLGLDLVRQDDGKAAVLPGVAIDGYGRELLLVDRAVFGRDVFDRYGTTRLDLWLEYRVELADDRLAPVECGGEGDPRRRYRAHELVEIVATRGLAKPDPRRPPRVPEDALEEPQLATPDDPALAWPVYLGRVVMQVPASGEPTFEIDASDRVYAGLEAAFVDHPGNATRLELGSRPRAVEARRVGDEDFRYASGADRDFAVFVPGAEGGDAPDPLEPTLAVFRSATQIRGVAEVHGNVLLDGASLQFPYASGGEPSAPPEVPTLYRCATPAGDELRIDLGDLAGGDRKLVIGLTKDGEFRPALEIGFASAAGAGTPTPTVTVHGDLRVEGIIRCDDVRARTVTEEVAALLAGMVQAGIASGGA